MANKQFDPKDISVIADGEAVADLDFIGWDDEMDNEKDESIDGNNTFIQGPRDMTATIGVKAVSESRSTLRELYENREMFTISMTFTEEEVEDDVSFLDGQLNSWGPSDDYEREGQPVWEGEFEMSDIDYN